MKSLYHAADEQAKYLPGAFQTTRHFQILKSGSEGTTSALLRHPDSRLLIKQQVNLLVS